MNSTENEQAALLRVVVKDALIRTAISQPDPIKFLLETRGELINSLVLGSAAGSEVTNKSLRADIVEAVREVWAEVIEHFERRAEGA